MELIQALERLSLEVRNKKVRHSKTYDDQLTNKTPQQQEKLSDNSIFSEGNNTHQQLSPDSAPRCPSAASQRQLDEFDFSIKTLFAQISDLDYKKIDHSNANDNHTHVTTSSSHSDSLRAGSLETSSEEFSDESSQRSSNNSHETTYHHEDPIVSYLLTRDLASITNTVKKISRILAIGSEIETLYQILVGIQSVYSPRRQTLNASSHVDSLYTRSLCDAFAELCTTEPAIISLPTILRYNDIRLKLLSQLDQSDGQSASESNETIECNFATEPADSDCAMEDSDNDESDLATLNAEQKNLEDEWTENKLYIDNSSR